MKPKLDIVPTISLKQVVTTIAIFLGIFFSVTQHAFAYEFSDVRNSLVRDLEKWQGYASRNKIAIVFNNENREQIKQNYNLVGIKRDLSHELLKSFDVADPIIVQEIVKSNKLEYRQIANEKSVLSQFADRANSVHVLLVDLQPKSKTLIAEFRLMNRDNSRISSVITEIPQKPTTPTVYDIEEETEPEDSGSSFFGSFGSSGASMFTAGQNDSWIYFAPTALLNPEINALHLALWFKDIGEADVQVVRFRYQLKLLELLQFGVQTYSITEKMNSEADEPNRDKESGLHSAYASLKFLLIDDTVLPVNLSLGARRRVYWDEDNTDFRSRDQIDKASKPEEYDDAKEVDENNDRYNTLTLQAMVTGKLDSLGVLYNVYVDNQTIVTGVKYVLIPEVKLFADNIYYYHKDPSVLSDTAAGIQIYNAYGSVDLMYQFETKQIQLALNVDF